MADLQLSGILSPCSLPVFLSEYFGFTPLHVPGSAGRFSALEGTAAFHAFLHDVEFVLEAPVEGEFVAGEQPLQSAETDLLVLQLAGQDHWTLHLKEPEAGVPPNSEVLLSDGGALYLPRGLWHSVCARGATLSRRLSIAIRNPTGAELLTWICGRVQQHETFQSDLPRFAGPAAQSAHLTAMRRAVMRALRMPDLLLRYSRRLNNQAPPGAASTIGEISSESIISFAAPRRPRIRRHDWETIFLVTGGRELMFPLDAAPLLHYLIDNAPLSFGAFHGYFESRFDREELAGLLASLASSGIVSATVPGAVS